VTNGIGTRVRARLLPLFLLLACSAATAAQKPCELRLASQVGVYIDPAGQAFVPVSLNGHAGVMALHLGSGLPALYEGYIDELGISDRLRSNDWDATIGGKRIEKQVRVESTLLGTANFTGWNFQVYPFGSDYRPRVGKLPVFGQMTSAFMNVVDLELNLGAGQLKLFHPNKCHGLPVYWDAEVTGVELLVDETGHLSFAMEVEGKSFLASLNTADRLSVISAAAAERYLGIVADSQGAEHETLPGESEVATFRALSLTAAGLNVQNPRFRIKDMPNCGLGAETHETSRLTRSHGGKAPIGCKDYLAVTPLSIGTDLMKRLRIYVSLADEKIYFARSDAPEAGAQAGSAGGSVGGGAVN
jgi:hypothetical protein